TGKVKVLGIVVLLLGLLGGGLLARSKPIDESRSATPDAKKGETPASGGTKSMTISGRVFGPDGKPVAGAGVAVVARQGVLLSSWHGWTSLRNEILGQGKTDPQGRFQLTVPRSDPSMNVRTVRV